MARTKRSKKKRSMKDRVRKVSQESKEKRALGTIRLPNGIERYEEKKGYNLLDIIPYEVSVPNHPDGIELGELWYRMPYMVHFGIGIDNRTFVCPRTFRKPCPICEYMSMAAKKGTLDEDSIKALKPKNRVLYNVIPRGRKDDQEIHVWDISAFLFQDMLDEEILEGEEEWGAFADLEGGYTIKVRFSEEKFAGRSFLKASRIDFIERDDYDESVLEDVVKLDKELNLLSYTELEKRFLELEDEDEEEVEEVEEVKPKRKSYIKKKEEVVEEDIDDEPPFDTEEEEEEVKEEKKKPKRKSRRKKSNKCPAGHKFGEDFDEFDECDDCEMFDECEEAFEKLDE